MSEAENMREMARYMAEQYILGNRELVIRALFYSCPRILVPLLTLEMASFLVKHREGEDALTFMMTCRAKANEWDRKAYCTTAWVELEDHFADYQQEQETERQ